MAVSPIYVELIEFRGKHGANMWLFALGRRNNVVLC